MGMQYLQVSELAKQEVVSRQHVFLKAEDGIRYVAVTGVQTCALPICALLALADVHLPAARREQRVEPGAPVCVDFGGRGWCCRGVSPRVDLRPGADAERFGRRGA